ncbi:MAG: phosphoribosyltransferase family protein [Candidatus Neomarinimicrobiota bacterium]
MNPLAQLLPDPLALLFPRLCVICSAPLQEEQTVCDSCLADLVPVNPADLHLQKDVKAAVDGIWSAFWFDDVMQELIHLLKYRGHRRLGVRLAAAAHGVLSEKIAWHSYDALVPVPLHRRKQRERGYNQALVLTAGLAGLVGLPVMDRLVVRHRWTRSQTGLTRDQRLANVAGSFRATRRCDGQKILLMDDVLTTGATAAACGAALKAGGAEEVAVITVATPPPDGLTSAAGIEPDAV